MATGTPFFGFFAFLVVGESKANAKTTVKANAKANAGVLRYAQNDRQMRWREVKSNNGNKGKRKSKQQQKQRHGRRAKALEC
jgi:predicted transcriptional regulator